MAEFDTTNVYNPLDEDFQVRFNGELYTIGDGETKTFPEFLAFHIAKHLSDKVLTKNVEKLKKENKENPYNPKLAQLMIYDNAERRIALFDILQSKDIVERCIGAYPFKGLIGDLSKYDEYVSKSISKATRGVADKEETPTRKSKAPSVGVLEE